MCEPTTLALMQFGIGAASAVSGYQGAKQEAAQQNALFNKNTTAAQIATGQQYTQTQLRQIQDEEAAGADKMEMAREGRAARATATVAAGEAGVSGLSVNSILQEFYGREGQYNATTDKNTKWSRAQTDMTLKGIQAGGQDRINSVQRANKPSFFDAALRIAGAGVDARTDYIRNK